jgi:hypothetical protein
LSTKSAFSKRTSRQWGQPPILRAFAISDAPRPRAFMARSPGVERHRLWPAPRAAAVKKGPAVRGAQSRLDSVERQRATPTADLIGGIRATSPRKRHDAPIYPRQAISLRIVSASRPGKSSAAFFHRPPRSRTVVRCVRAQSGYSSASSGNSGKLTCASSAATPRSVVGSA